MNQYFCWFIDIFAHAIVAGCTQKKNKNKRYDENKRRTEQWRKYN